MRLRGAIPLCTFLGVALASHSARATVVACEPLGAPGVVVNFCSNHGYYPRSEPLRLQHAAYGLSVVRERLVAVGLLRPLPILVQVPAFAGNSPLRIGLRQDCAIDPGEVEDAPTPIGACYFVETDGPLPSYEALVTEVALLSTLSDTEPERVFENAQVLPRPSKAAASHTSGVRFEEEPALAPGGRHSVRERWQDGKLSLVLFAGEREVRTLPLTTPLAARPIWSEDGAWVAYASLEEAVAVQVATGTTRRYRISKLLESSQRTLEVLLSFVSTHTLRLKAEEDLWSSYSVWDLDLVRGSAVKLPEAL